MGKRLALLLCTGACIAAMASAAGNGQGPQGVAVQKALDRVVQGGVQPFAILPVPPDANGALRGHPEGVCADAEGNIYANSFDLPTSFTPFVYVQNYIYRFDRQGQQVSATPTPFAVVPLGCTVSGNKFYVNEVLSGTELEYTLPLTDTSQPTRTFPICAGYPVCAINANYTGPDGRIYISDNGAGLLQNFDGRIWVLDPRTGTSSVFIDSQQKLRMIVGTPSDYVPSGNLLPYSANGIAFSRDGAALYIANMSSNIIYKQKVKNCSVACETQGGLSVFSHDPFNLIQGPDNIDFDANGNLWIASGQNDHVVVLNSVGNVVGVFGSFEGFDQNGAPRGLLQPSGIIFANGMIYVGNESNQSLVPASKPVDWPALKLFTIARIDPGVLMSNGK